MIKDRCGPLITAALIVLIFVFLGSSNLFAQSIDFPIDHNGYAILQGVGYFLEIIGMVENPTPPDWRSLMDWDGPSCAHFDSVEAWNCNNPEREGHRSLFFYYKFQVYFDDKCEGEICFSAKSRPQFGEVCIRACSTAVGLTAQIKDFCNHEVNSRLPALGQFVDKEEGIYFTARLQRDNCIGEFPDVLTGRKRGCEGMYPYEVLYLSSSDSTFAYYVGNAYHVRSLFPNCGAGILTFTVPYGTNASYNTYVGEAQFIVNDVIFEDTIGIYDIYGSNAACYADGSRLKLSIDASVSEPQGWPPDCEKFIGVIEGYEGAAWVVTSADTIRHDHFICKPCTSSYEINGFAEDVFSLNWKARVNYWDRREVNTNPTQLRIFHAFRADSIIFTQPLPDTVHVGDTLYIKSNPYPLLHYGQERIEYVWHADPINHGGHFKYNFYHHWDNKFWSDSAGTFQLYYTIEDTVSGYLAESPHKTINVVSSDSGLVIDYPPRDTTYWITGDPTMPQIKCRAHIAGIDTTLQRELTFNWKIKLKYRNYILERQGSCKGIKDWIPNWGTDFGGDTVFVDVGVKFGADSLVAHIVALDSVRVRGQNPAQDSARSYLRAGYEEQHKARQAEVIGQMESNYRQFYTSGDTSGWPIVSRDGGVGMMQITVAAPERNIFWSWKINADTGKGMLAGKWISSNGWFDNWVGRHWPVPTTDNRLYDTYCRYNGGNYYSAVESEGDSVYVRNIIWTDSCGTCNPNNRQADRDTVVTHSCRQSGCCYADDAMEIH